MVKADTLLSASGTLTYFDYRQNRIGKAIFVDSKDGYLQWSRLLTKGNLLLVLLLLVPNLEAGVVAAVFAVVVLAVISAAASVVFVAAAEDVSGGLLVLVVVFGVLAGPGAEALHRRVFIGGGVLLRFLLLVGGLDAVPKTKRRRCSSPPVPRQRGTVGSPRRQSGTHRPPTRRRNPSPFRPTIVGRKYCTPPWAGALASALGH